MVHSLASRQLHLGQCAVYLKKIGLLNAGPSYALLWNSWYFETWTW